MSIIRTERFTAMAFVLILGIVVPSLLAAGNNIDVVIPKPQKVIKGHGTFHLNRGTRYLSDTSLAGNAIHYLQEHLKRNAGYSLQQGRSPAPNSIRFRYDPKKIRRSEAYTLKIGKEQIRIEARDTAGFFYAVISLMQLMDPAIWSVRTHKKQKHWAIPSCTIEDYPRYRWRGMMLDVSRNFFSKAYVKKFIDRMAQQKLNRFHWHLTDDEGWRIEIKRYPLLTKTGSKRGPGTKLPFSVYPTMRGPKNRVQSGYYTQQDIREIVTYAKARSIEILPEIDMPGHAKAAVTAYPRLLQDPKDKSRYRSVQKVSNNTINPGVESTYTFLNNVLSEVAGLFPFGYIHLGGDEVPKGAWSRSPAVKKLRQQKGLKSRREVQNYFFTRMDGILARHHKKMIAWQEVLSGKPKLRQSDIFMAWKSPKAGFKAIGKHRNIIMAPVQYLYFDQQYARSQKEPGHTWSTPVSTHKTYSFNPGYSQYLKGVHACLWSETLLNEKIADYLAWPRTFALSEVAWTEQKHRQWKDFRERVSKYGFKRLKIQQVYYRP